MSIEEIAVEYANHKLMSTDLPGLGHIAAFEEFMEQAIDVLSFAERHGDMK